MDVQSGGSDLEPGGSRRNAVCLTVLEEPPSFRPERNGSSRSARASAHRIRAKPLDSSFRSSERFRQDLFREATFDEWNDWRWQLRKRIRD